MKNTTMMNTKAGRMLRRLVGEETGAVMMEYVILAVLIAAAAVVAIAYFGRTIVGEANVATSAMATGGNEAAGKQDQIKSKSAQYTQEAVETNKKFSDAKEDAVK